MVAERMLRLTVLLVSETILTVVSRPRFAFMPETFPSLLLQPAFPLAPEILAAIAIMVAVSNALRRVMLALMIAS
jgi:hypothetical protein